MTRYMYMAMVAWLLLVVGWLLRRKKRLHVPLALSGIFLDIALVVYLQLTREAVQTALSFTLNPFKQIHIAVSTIALFLYIPVMILGARLFYDGGNRPLRNLHVKLAITALVFRTLGFLFMFSMLDRYR